MAQREAMRASITPASDSMLQPPRAIDAWLSRRAPRAASASSQPAATKAWSSGFTATVIWRALASTALTASRATWVTSAGRRLNSLRTTCRASSVATRATLAAICCSSVPSSWSIAANS